MVLHPNYPSLVFSHWCKDTGRSHPAEQRDTHPTDAINEPSTVCRPEILLCLWGHDTLPPTRHHHYTIVVIIFRIVCSPSVEPIKRRQIKVSRKLLSPCLTSHQRILSDKEMVIADKYLITIRKS